MTGHIELRNTSELRLYYVHCTPRKKLQLIIHNYILMQQIIQVSYNVHICAVNPFKLLIAVIVICKTKLNKNRELI